MLAARFNVVHLCPNLNMRDPGVARILVCFGNGEDQNQALRVMTTNRRLELPSQRACFEFKRGHLPRGGQLRQAFGTGDLCNLWEVDRFAYGSQEFFSNALNGVWRAEIK
jgi:hypothetical protein